MPLLCSSPLDTRVYSGQDGRGDDRYPWISQLSGKALMYVHVHCTFPLLIKFIYLSNQLICRIVPSLFKLDIPLTNIRIHIKPPLFINRNPLPNLLNHLGLKISIHNLLGLPSLRQKLRPGIRNQAVTPCGVIGIHISSWAAETNVDLIIHRPRPSQQWPV